MTKNKGGKIAIGCLFLLGTIAIVLGILFFKYDKKLPEGTQGQAAEKMADDMLEAINKNAWDTLHYIRWTFMDKHHYTWDKLQNMALIEWDDHYVIMQLDSKESKAVKANTILSGHEKNTAASKAWALWCNDSFWLAAPYKIRDAGTQQSLIKNEDGSQGLMVSYISGGVTPGDSYLWQLDENNRPKSWKMWTQILPLGGIETSWEDWTEISPGVSIAQNHRMTGMNVSITNLSGGQSLSDIGYEEDPFIID